MGNAVEGIYETIINDLNEYKAFQKEQDEFDMEQLINQLIEDITKDEKEYKNEKLKAELDGSISHIASIYDAYRRGKDDGLKMAAKSFAAGVGIGLVGLVVASKLGKL